MTINLGPILSLPLLRTPALRRLESTAEAPLMERAGAAAAEWAAQLCADRAAPVLIVAGPGNNGGDAFVAARLLRAGGHTVEVVFAGAAEALPADAVTAHAALLAAGGTTRVAIPDGRRWCLVIDGLFGIGLKRDIAGVHGELVAAMNTLARQNRCPLLALDCPSGLDADTGSRRGATVLATHTLTFIAAKPGLLTAEGPDHCGEIRIAPLGLAVDTLLPGLALNPTEHGRTVGGEHFATWLQRRPRNSHKGSFGSAGIIGGAPGMTGAAMLAGRAALRLGAGRVYLGLPEGLPGDFDPLQPELMLRDSTLIFDAPLTALACGPGLGRSDEAAAALEAAIDSDLPLVLDADALNLLAGGEEFRIGLASRRVPTVLTPHPAEAARLLDSYPAAVQADRIAAARELAAQFGALVVLKGCGTIVAAADGRWWLNTTGNPGLATAGSGDVLTGMLVALLAQGWPIEAASLAAVHLHGVAADALRDELGGDIGMAASELAEVARRHFNRWVADAAALTGAP